MAAVGILIALCGATLFVLGLLPWNKLPFPRNLSETIRYFIYGAIAVAAFVAVVLVVSWLAR